MDDEMCTEPVRLRLLAARAGAPRSPVRVAAPYDPDETFHETSTSETVRDSSLKGGSSLKDENRDAHAEGADDTIAANANALANARSPPGRSPFGLLEEILWADEWKMLVACMMLNCTTRVQVDRVLWRLFATTPTARAAVKLGREGRRTASRGAKTSADDEKDADGFSVAGASLLEAILAPLGLHRKRARAFVRLSEDYLRARLEGEEEERERDSRATRDGSKRSSLSPQKVSTLHGVGAYASDAHALFCENVLGVAPRDHALRWWYAWAIERREGERRKAAERRRAGKE
jgi:methyl-CpG-binding domain protein 4